MEQEIRIVAEPVDSQRCRFMVDRPVYPDGAVYFPSREKARGSPLAERLFEIENVTAVLVSNNVVTVTKGDDEDWRIVGKAVGGAIRGHLWSGSPAVSAEARASIPDENDIREKVQRLLDEEINPAVASHGGYVELLGVHGNSVFIQLGGGCQGCGMADVTLKHGIEVRIRELIPEVGEILDTTDHAAGRNPYFAPSKK